MPLSDMAARKAKPTERPYKLADSGGLFLLVQPGGSKLWKLKYRYQGKEKLLEPAVCQGFPARHVGVIRALRGR